MLLNPQTVTHAVQMRRQRHERNPRRYYPNRQATKGCCSYPGQLREDGGLRYMGKIRESAK